MNWFGELRPIDSLTYGLLIVECPDVWTSFMVWLPMMWINLLFSIQVREDPLHVAVCVDGSEKA